MDIAARSVSARTAPAGSGATKKWPDKMPNFREWRDVKAFIDEWQITGVMTKAQEMLGRDIRSLPEFATYAEAWKVIDEIATLKGLNL